MIEEANAGGDVVLALALNFKGAADLRFLRVALDGGGSHSTPSISFTFSTTAMAFSSSKRRRISSRVE